MAWGVIILKFVAVISYLLYLSTKLKTGFHMLQQNSYLSTNYLKWVRRNISKNILIYDFSPGLAALCVSMFTNEAYVYFVWTAINIIIFLSRRKTKSKKPLVVTARVKRLIFTSAIFTILLTFWLYMVLTPYWIIFVTMIFNAISFFYVAFINIINRPVELAINRWYYNDAKRIIRSMNNLKVIGITGSYGKTSSKYILTKILSQKYHTLMTPESYNTTMGVVRTIREQLKPSHEIFVCEMGAKYVNDIKEICDLVNPEYGIITSIGPQHLETFGSMENIIKTKFELVDSLKDKSKAVLNISSKHIKDNTPKDAVIYSSEEDEGGEYFASDITYGKTGAEFMMCKKGMPPFKIETKLLGKHNITNIVGATSVALKLGLTPEEIAYAVKRLEPVPHRLQLKKQNGGITVIDDAFNSNVEGAKSALEVLGNFPEGYRMLITPGMIELGEKEFEYNYNFGYQAAKNCDFIILVGEKQTEPIKKGLFDAEFDENSLYIAKDLDDALVKMREIATEGWTVLFENDLPDLYES